MSVRDNPELTSRERQVAELLARRWTNKEIADALVVSERTVETHVAHILAKLGVHSRLQVRRRLNDSGKSVESTDAGHGHRA